MKRFCLTLDLADDPALQEAYDEHHRKVWPEVISSIRGAGIISMDIYRQNTRLVMFMETEDSFSFEQKAAADAANETVQKWENLMWTYQRAVPGSKPGEKWILMNNIFSL